MNNVVDDINCEGKNGKRCQDIKGEFRISSVHEEDTHRNQRNKVHQVHDGRTGEHPYPAYILGHATHKVTCTMGLIKTGIQLLVMIKDLIFLIKLDMAAHYDNRLPH